MRGLPWTKSKLTHSRGGLNVLELRVECNKLNISEEGNRLELIERICHKNEKIEKINATNAIKLEETRQQHILKVCRRSRSTAAAAEAAEGSQTVGRFIQFRGTGEIVQIVKDNGRVWLLANERIARKDKSGVTWDMLPPGLSRKNKKKLYIYKLRKSASGNYDNTFDAAIVVAHSADDAVHIHPANDVFGMYAHHQDLWQNAHEVRSDWWVDEKDYSEWVHPTKVHATMLSAVSPNSKLKAGMVVMASYRREPDM